MIPKTANGCSFDDLADSAGGHVFAEVAFRQVRIEEQMVSSTCDGIIFVSGQSSHGLFVSFETTCDITQRTRPTATLLASLQVRQIRWLLSVAFAMTLMDNVRGQGMLCSSVVGSLRDDLAHSARDNAKKLYPATQCYACWRFAQQHELYALEESLT